MIGPGPLKVGNAYTEAAKSMLLQIHNSEWKLVSK